MSTVFFYADPHFSHANICAFVNADGSALRPWSNVEEMDEELVSRWNATVSPEDKTYILGDVVMSHKALPILDRLNGKKILIKGNHDIHPLKKYAPYFKDIRGYHVLDGCILSHIPIHADSMARFGTNIHGHLHSNRVRLPIGFDVESETVIYGDKIDPRYFCVSVEHIDYTPISFDEVKQKIIDQGGSTGFKPKNNSIPD